MINIITKFEEIYAWQEARKLNKKLFGLSKNGPLSRDYLLKKELIKSSNSVVFNIAEGFGRRSDKEFSQFLNISRGSLSEIQAGLYLALDREYISENDFQELYGITDQISRMTGGLINYIKSKERNKQKQQ